MSTRYKLPDWLGGHEVVHYGAMVGGWPIVYFDSGECIALHPDHLTKVEPPLPTEPPDRTHMGCNGYVFTRRDDTANARLNPDRRWFDEHGDGVTWAEVVAYSEQVGAPLVRLVPDPAADAPEPELPCTVPTKWASRQLLIEKADTDGYIALYTTEEPTSGRSALLTAKAARLAAVALLRAAREVEKP